MFDKMGAKSKVIDELMQHLNAKDDDDFASAIKPKGDGVAAIEIDKVGGDKPEGDDPSKAPGADGDDAALGDPEAKGPEMSDDELQELIEALQSKLGA